MFFIYHALIENRLLTNFLIVTLVSRVGIMPKKNWVSRSLKPRVVQTVVFIVSKEMFSLKHSQFFNPLSAFSSENQPYFRLEMIGVASMI